MTTATEREKAKREYLARYFREVKRKYGLTEEGWRDLFRAQHGRCAICGDPFRLNKIGRGGRMPAVDHDHLSGYVRGLLCGGSLDAKTCNRLIGYYNATQLQRGADYLRNPPAFAVIGYVRKGDDLDAVRRAAEAVGAEALRIRDEIGHQVGRATDAIIREIETEGP